MSQSNATALVEVRPLKPFVGSYKCGLSEADVIDDETVEKDGIITKVRVARKRFAGFVPVQRFVSDLEFDRIKAGDVPATWEIVSFNKAQPNIHDTQIIEHPTQRTLQLPADLAQSLVTRGLAEIVKGGRR